MKRFSEQLKKQSESIRLTPSERADLRVRLTTYMEYHPLPASMRPVEKKTRVGASLTSQPFIALPINWFYVRGAATAFALMMMVTVPVMAEYTTPGDMLYPVKVRFNEEVRSGLTLNPYEKIEWETERLERRISEARLLASEGRLTGELEAVVATAVKEHSDNAKAQIAALRVTDKDDAAIAEIAFATALSVQSEVLDKTMAMKHGDAKRAATDGSAEVLEGSVLASVVAEETSEAEASQAATTPSYPKLMARVEMDTTAAFELFNSVKNQASPEEVVDIERRLEDIKRKVSLAVASQNPAPVVVPVVEEVSDSEDANQVPADDVSLMMTSVADGGTATDTEASSTEEVVEETIVEEVPAEVVPVVPPVVLTEGEAVEVLRGVMADLRKLISFMTDIDVRQAVSVEELVPITLTPEEHQSQVLTDLETIKAFTATYAGAPLTGPGSEKINAGVTEVVRLQAEVEAALETEGVAVAEGNARAALILLGDLESMIKTVGATVAPTVEELPVE